MYILHIEHAVPDFDRWKKAFDDDPVGRERSGVRGYVVARPVDDPRYAIVDLRFDSREGVGDDGAAGQDPRSRRVPNVTEGGAP